MADFTLKKGDTLPALSASLVDAAGNAIDLTNATVRFRLRKHGETALKVDAAGAVLTPSQGLVAYAWAPEDTDTPGLYQAEWVVTYLGGEVFSAPNNAFLSVQVHENLDD